MPARFPERWNSSLLVKKWRGTHLKGREGIAQLALCCVPAVNQVSSRNSPGCGEESDFGRRRTDGRRRKNPEGPVGTRGLRGLAMPQSESEEDPQPPEVKERRLESPQDVAESTE